MSAKTFMIRTLVALASVMCLAVHKWTGFDPLKWLGLIFYFICFAMYVKAFFIALTKTKKVTADLLVLTVMVVSFLAGQPLGGALVAWFISMGLAISFAIIERSRRRIESLTKEKDKIVRILKDGKILELPIEQVCQGDVVIVPQGEMIPVDGEIVDGASSIEESVITGEPFTVFKKAGDSVTSGAISLTSQLRIKATKDGDKGFIYVMAKEIEASLKVKPKIHRTADGIVQFFIPGVVLYAIGVFLFSGGLTGDFDTALIRMAAVTAVACPCAWALSVPTAFAAAIGGLSGRGILVRGGTPLEVTGRAVNVVLDKTGTVTLGEPKIVGIESLGSPQDELLQIAASVESGFNHPIANAIVSYASAKGVRPLKAEESEYLPGFGIRSSVEGRKVVLGPAETLATLGMSAPSELKVKGRATWIVIDGKIAGAIVIQDELRDSAKGLGGALRDLGIKRVELATGDNDASEAKRVARLIGADGYRFGLKPEDKTAIIKDLSAQGPTVMVGDGVNDATSLSVADVGISIGRAKADLAIKSSDIIVLQGDVTSLLTIVKTGKKLIRVIKQNYVWAIGFNSAGIALATAGLLSPWLAALFHHISSVLVVLNSARLVRDKGMDGNRHSGRIETIFSREGNKFTSSASSQRKENRVSSIFDPQRDVSYRLMIMMFKVMDLFKKPDGELDQFNIKKGFTVVDYGCGPGRYIKKAVRLVGEEGKVYAVDINKIAIGTVTNIIKENKMENVIPVLAENTVNRIDDHCAEVVYALDMFHQVDDPVGFLGEIHRIVKKNGSLFLEDGHQPREKTITKIARSKLWRIIQEHRRYVRLVPVEPHL